MCTVVLLRRPGHIHPLIIGANRDESATRPWSAPARHWPDRPETTAGLDDLAGGSWLGVNDFGLCAAILNRMGTLGPAPGKRSRGELVLDALDHADADQAIEALAQLNGTAYRPFNMIIADNRDAFWLRSDGSAELRAQALPPGLHMISALDLNDAASPRIAAYLPRFQAAAVPDPSLGDWAAWSDLLADHGCELSGEESAAMCFLRPDGFGTVSSSLISLPDLERAQPMRWLFADSAPGSSPYRPIHGVARRTMDGNN